MWVSPWFRFSHGLLRAARHTRSDSGGNTRSHAHGDSHGPSCAYGYSGADQYRSAHSNTHESTCAHTHSGAANTGPSTDVNKSYAGAH